MQFALNKWTDLHVTHINKRLENHGQDMKHAMDISWRFEGGNPILDTLPGQLREAFYYGDSTESIPGVEKVTPNLRTNKLDGAVKIIYEGSGYLITIEDGAVSGSKFELGGADIKHFKILPKADAFVTLTFITQHVGLTPETMARIMSMDGKAVRALMMPPEMQDGTQPVKMTKAQEKAKAKKDAEAAFSQDLPFKYGAKDGKVIDRTPAAAEKDKKEPEAGDAFGDAVTSGKTTAAKPAPAKQAAAKKPAAKKTKPRTGKGN